MVVWKVKIELSFTGEYSVSATTPPLKTALRLNQSPQFTFVALGLFKVVLFYSLCYNIFICCLYPEAYSRGYTGNVSWMYS